MAVVTPTGAGTIAATCPSAPDVTLWALSTSNENYATSYDPSRPDDVATSRPRTRAVRLRSSRERDVATPFALRRVLVAPVQMRQPGIGTLNNRDSTSHIRRSGSLAVLVLCVGGMNPRNRLAVVLPDGQCQDCCGRRHLLRRRPFVPHGRHRAGAVENHALGGAEEAKARSPKTLLDGDQDTELGYQGRQGVTMDLVIPGRRDFEPPRISVLGGFQVRVGDRAMKFPFQAQRVIAYLAITGVTETRDRLAGRLWPFGTQNRADANLRSALWRINSTTESLVESTRSQIALRPDVVVDCRVAGAQARSLVAGDGMPCPCDANAWEHELLPGWDEDWLLIERERLRQLRIHALEALSRLCLEQGRFLDAIDVALAAVSLEPLRESAQMVLVEAHLAEGNPSEAHRQFTSYRELLHAELGISPSSRLRDLLTGSP